MMRMAIIAAGITALLAYTGPSGADVSVTETGGDTFVAGETITQTLNAAGDVFVAGRSATVLGDTAGDFHASGFDVVVGSDIGEDAYLAGFTVTLRGSVAQDLTAAAFTLRTDAGARVSGNARLAGASVIINGPVDGALSVAGRDVVLNAPVQGDVRLTAATIEFGPEAKIAGQLIYTAKDEISVPERVIPDERVVFEPFSGKGFWDEWEEIKEMPVGPSTASMFFGFLVSLLFFVALGAIALGFFPKKVSWLRKSVAEAPGRTLMLGVIGLSVLFGLVPVTAMTIVGLPFVLIALLAIVVIWTLAYALGAYAVAMRIWVGFGNDTDPGMPARLLVFAAAIVVVALLNFIPFVGWVANYTLVLLGVGAMTHATLRRFLPDPDQAMDVDMHPVEESTSSN